MQSKYGIRFPLRERSYDLHQLLDRLHLLEARKEDEKARTYQHPESVIGTSDNVGHIYLSTSLCYSNVAQGVEFPQFLPGLPDLSVDLHPGGNIPLTMRGESDLFSPFSREKTLLGVQV
jgi:hypothetical protein